MSSLVVTSYPNRLYFLSASICTINRGGTLTVTIANSVELDCEALPFVLLSEEGIKKCLHSLYKREHLM